MYIDQHACSWFTGRRVENYQYRSWEPFLTANSKQMLYRGMLQGTWTWFWGRIGVRNEEWRGFLYAEIVQIPSWLLLPRRSLLSQNISLLQVCRSSPPKYSTLKTTIEKGTRDKAVKNLSAFLSNSPKDALPALEMAKLWKGIFYCPYTLKNLIRSSSNDLNRLLDVRQTIGATGTCERTSRNFANNL